MIANDGWDFSTEELLAIRKKLASTISLEQLFKKYSRRVEATGGDGFKCICPNPGHKEGNERSPSCHFKEGEKTFYCFGCDWRGDPFDLIGRMSGCSGESIVQELTDKEDFDLASIEVVPQPPRLDLARINQKMSTMLRDHLLFFKDTDCYKEECRWTDQTFKKIDDRMAYLEPTDIVQARQFYEGIRVDLERRSSNRIDACV